MTLPPDKVLLVATDSIQDEAFICFRNVGLCVALLVGEVHLTHDRHIVLSWLLHHLPQTRPACLTPAGTLTTLSPNIEGGQCPEHQQHTKLLIRRGAALTLGGCEQFVMACNCKCNCCHGCTQRKQPWACQHVRSSVAQCSSLNVADQALP